MTGFIRSRSRDAKRNPGDPLLVFESRIWNKDQRLVDRAAGNLSTNRDRACRNSLAPIEVFFSATSVSTFGSRRAPAPRESAFEKRARLLLAREKSYGGQSEKRPAPRGCDNLEIRTSWLESVARPHFYPHDKMAALSAVAPVLNKAPVVSTGKAANTNSMMVWQPHGNKCVSPPAPRARLPRTTSRCSF